MLSLCLRRAAQPGNVRAVLVGRGGGHAAMAAVIERQNVTVQPTGAALAADIAGVDLAGAVGPETVAAVKAAWGDHLVLRFRGQRLSDDDLMRFSRQFGELDWAPIAAAKDAPEGRDYIMVVSNVVENGQAIGQLGAYEAIWQQWLWENAQLRARMSFALSEIFVISNIAPDLDTYAMASYMDMLNRDLLLSRFSP
jgi:hypothetical protein